MAAVITAALFIGCPPTPPDEPPPVEGRYSGIYLLKNSSHQTIEQHITWVFTPVAVFMDLDTTIQPESSRQFCDIEGRYLVGDGIDIYIPIVAGRDSLSFKNRTQKACNETLGPFGRFQLDQSAFNKVVLSRVNISDTSFQRIMLTRVSDEY
ncbi:MAG: hypothetical protein IPH75_00205 [bacterium]|nr:hypothetical protein [bacterium]